MTHLLLPVHLSPLSPSMCLPLFLSLDAWQGALGGRVHLSPFVSLHLSPVVFQPHVSPSAWMPGTLSGWTASFVLLCLPSFVSRCLPTWMPGTALCVDGFICLPLSPFSCLPLSPSLHGSLSLPSFLSRCHVSPHFSNMVSQPVSGFICLTLSPICLPLSLSLDAWHGSLGVTCLPLSPFICLPLCLAGGCLDRFICLPLSPFICPSLDVWRGPFWVDEFICLPSSWVDKLICLPLSQPAQGRQMNRARDNGRHIARPAREQETNEGRQRETNEPESSRQRLGNKKKQMGDVNPQTREDNGAQMKGQSETKEVVRSESRWETTEDKSETKGPTQRAVPGIQAGRQRRQMKGDKGRQMNPSTQKAVDGFICLPLSPSVWHGPPGGQVHLFAFVSLRLSFVISKPGCLARLCEWTDSFVSICLPVFGHGWLDAWHGSLGGRFHLFPTVCQLGRVQLSLCLLLVVSQPGCLARLCGWSPFVTDSVCSAGRHVCLRLRNARLGM